LAKTVCEVPILAEFISGGEVMQRPTGVTILTSFYILFGGFLGILGLLLIFGRASFSGLSGPADTGLPPTAQGIALVGGLCLFVSLLNVICAIGFIRLVKWSRVLAIVFHLSWAILGALSLVGLRSHPNVSSLMFRLVVLLVQVWIVVYLLVPKVKQAFSAKSV
jgi:hypothetical protein